jgi:L-lactate dehydrogenase complex protein LldE
MPPTVQLFVTCLIDTLQPHIGEAVLKVLTRAGVEVEFPRDQTCCGQPAFNAGMRAEARQVAEHTIRVFEKEPGYIVIPSGSCTAMIRHSYLELFADDPDWFARAQALAERSYEFSEFLVDVLGISSLGARFPESVTYHGSCHLLRGLGIDRQPRLLLENVGDINIVELPYFDDCCGFGGVFSVKHPEISTAMLERKIVNIDNSGAPIVVTCDTGCLMNIGGGLHRRRKTQKVIHIAEILAST